MEEIKKIEVQGQQYGVADMLMRSVMGGNAQVIEWSHTHNMNDYKDACTYRIKGERTGNPMSDNLPIMNQGSGHTVDGLLYVLDSSLTNGSGKESDCTVTQILMLSNRVGGQEGDMYMRSAYGANKDSLTWKPWEKYQTNMEIGVVNDVSAFDPQNPTVQINNKGLDSFVDNGIYSGVYVSEDASWDTQPQNIETFVMVVINNYAVAGDMKTVTQIKFAVTNGGVFSIKTRRTLFGSTSNFGVWQTFPFGNVSIGSGVSLVDYSKISCDPDNIALSVNRWDGSIGYTHGMDLHHNGDVKFKTCIGDENTIKTTTIKNEEDSLEIIAKTSKRGEETDVAKHSLKVNGDLSVNGGFSVNGDLGISHSSSSYADSYSLTFTNSENDHWHQILLDSKGACQIFNGTMSGLYAFPEIGQIGFRYDNGNDVYNEFYVTHNSDKVTFQHQDMEANYQDASIAYNTNITSDTLSFANGGSIKQQDKDANVILGGEGWYNLNEINIGSHVAIGKMTVLGKNVNIEEGINIRKNADGNIVISVDGKSAVIQLS